MPELRHARTVEYVAMAAGHANAARRMPDLYAMPQFTASLTVTLSLQMGG